MYLTDLVSLGKSIRMRRLERGLTQEDLAEMCGLSSGYIGDLERAERVPSLHVIVSLSYALEVPPGWLLYETFPEDLFGFLDKPFKLRAPDRTLRNTLTNWYFADLPDESMIGEPPVTKEQLSRLGFTLLGEDFAPFPAD